MTDNIKRRIISPAVRILATLALVLTFVSCGAVRKAAIEKISQIRIYDFHIEEFNAVSLRCADLKFRVKIYNPTIKLSLKDISITSSYKGKDITTISLEPIVLPKRSESEHHISTRMELLPSASVLDLAALLAKSNDKEQVKVRIRANGVASNVILYKFDETMSLKELMNAASSIYIAKK